MCEYEGPAIDPHETEYKAQAKIRELGTEVALLKGMLASYRRQLREADLDKFRLDLVEALVYKQDMKNQVDLYYCDSEARSFREYLDFIYKKLVEKKKTYKKLVEKKKTQDVPNIKSSRNSNTIS